MNLQAAQNNIDFQKNLEEQRLLQAANAKA
jgi:hypothetical protein